MVITLLIKAGIKSVSAKILFSAELTDFVEWIRFGNVKFELIQDDSGSR